MQITHNQIKNKKKQKNLEHIYCCILFNFNLNYSSCPSPNKKKEMESKSVDLSLIGVIAIAIVFSILVTILYKKFRVNDTIITEIDSRLALIDEDIDSLKTSVHTLQHYPQYAEFYSFDDASLSNGGAYAIQWGTIDVSNNCHFRISGIGGDQYSNAIKVPKASTYQITTTLQLANNEQPNDAYAWYAKNGTIIAQSKRHVDIKPVVGEIVLSQMIYLTCEDILSVFVEANNDNAYLFQTSNNPSARLSVVRL